MRIISLTQNMVAIVDESDYESLSQYRWHVDKQGGNLYYAVRTTSRLGGRQKIIFMHRIILNAKNGVLVDHINRDGLDNRRSNLRLCNRSENDWNQGLQKNNTSGFKGVSIYNRNTKKPYRAYIQVKKKLIHLGYYQTAEAAAQAYDAAALKYHGNFAVTNKTLRDTQTELVL